MNAYLVRIAGEWGTPDDADAVARMIKLAEGKPDRELDLNDSWAALHFMLSGEVPMPKQEAIQRGISWNDSSLENLIMGGEPTAYEASFGPARLLASDLVMRLSRKLSDLSVEEFLERYDAEEMNAEQIPPGGWADQEEARDLLGDRYLKLKEFYRSAAAANEAILIYMT